MRRSIDDRPHRDGDLPDGWQDDDLTAVSWGVAISDDYADGEPRVVVTVEEMGRPGEGLVAHLPAGVARRLRGALADALVEIGEPSGR